MNKSQRKPNWLNITIVITITDCDCCGIQTYCANHLEQNLCSTCHPWYMTQAGWQMLAAIANKLCRPEFDVCMTALACDAQDAMNSGKDRLEIDSRYTRSGRAETIWINPQWFFHPFKGGSKVMA